MNNGVTFAIGFIAGLIAGVASFSLS